MESADTFTAEEVHLIKSFVAMMKGKNATAFDRLIKPEVQDCATQTDCPVQDCATQTDSPAPVEKPKVILRVRRMIEIESEEEEENEEEETEEDDTEKEIATFRKLVHAYHNKTGLVRSEKDRISTDLRAFAKKHNIRKSDGTFYKAFHYDMIMKLNHRFGLEGDQAVR